MLPSFQLNKDRELDKIAFLGRFKPKQAKSNNTREEEISKPNDIVDLNDIELLRKEQQEGEEGQGRGKKFFREEQEEEEREE